MPLALIASAGVNANEYLAKHIADLGYPRPVIVASSGEARRRLAEKDFEIVVINTPLPDEFGHELGSYAVESSHAGVLLLAKSGTAEVGGDQTPNAMFAGFVQDDAYPLACIVAVEHGGSGSATCAPIAAAVLQACAAAMDAG